MGCNCGKNSQQFKNLVKQAQVSPINSVPTTTTFTTTICDLPPMSRAERIRLRNERRRLRDEGVARRSIARAARIKARQEAGRKT